MAINRLYRRAEQEWIEADISQEKARYNGISKKAVRYFKERAETYNLYERVLSQIKAHKAGILEAEYLTTNKEIAELFGVCRSSVSRYLENLALKSGKSEDFKEREHVLRSAGGSKGGKNGNKTANFKNHRSSRNS